MPFPGLALTYEHVVKNGNFILKTLVEIDADELVIFTLIHDLALCSAMHLKNQGFIFLFGI